MGSYLEVVKSSLIFASINESITFVCVQVKENSLETFTMSDAEVIQ